MPLDYLTSNLNVRFPFAEDVSLLSNESLVWPTNFLADAVIATSYARAGIYMSSATVGDHLTPNPYIDLEFSDNAGIINTIRIYFNDYVRFGIASNYDSLTDVVVRLVFGDADFIALGDMLAVLGDTASFTFASAAISEHALSQQARRALRFRVSEDSGTTWNAWRTKVPMTLKAGYNIDFTQTDAGVQIAAVPGSGLGRYSPGGGIIPTVDYLASLGGATADDRGNVRISGDTCYRVELAPSPGFARNEIKIHNDCAACCGCSDYALLGTALAYIQNLHDANATSLQNLASCLNAMIVDWNNVKLPDVRRKVHCVATIKPLGAGNTQFALSILLLNNKYRIPESDYDPTTATLVITLPPHWILNGTAGATTRAIEIFYDAASEEYKSRNTTVPSQSNITGDPPIVFSISSNEIETKEYYFISFPVSFDTTDWIYPDPGDQVVNLASVDEHIDQNVSFVVSAYATGLAPSSGPPGTLITITGAGFIGASAVMIGGSPATFSVVSGTSITATVPALPLGAALVTVVAPSGTFDAGTFTVTA